MIVHLIFSVFDFVTNSLFTFFIEQSYCVSAYDIYLSSSYLLSSDILGLH